MAQIRAETAAAAENEIARTSENQENATPMVRLVNSIIERAFLENASDIHFEPSEEEMVVRMRIDGQLHRIMTIPVELKDSVTSRLKIMSGKKDPPGRPCGPSYERNRPGYAYFHTANDLR